MPEAATIELPPIPKSGDTPPPAPSPDAGKTPLSAVFDRALGSQMPNPEPDAPPTEPDSPPVPPTTTPPPKTETATPPVTDEFVPPEILTGEPGKESAPTPEPSVADLMPEEPPVAIRTEKGKADYKKWREHQLSLESKVKDFEAKLKNQTPADKDVLAQNQLLTQRLMEMQSEFERIAPEFSPAFQNQFIKPHKAAVEAATQLMKEAELDPALLRRALDATGKERRLAIDEIGEKIDSPTTRMELVDLIVKINQLEQQRDAARADIKGTSEQLQMQERAERHRAAQQQAQQMGQLIDSVIDTLANQHGFEMYRTTNGRDPKWDEKVQQRIETARDLAVNSTNYEQMVAAVALGIAAPEYRMWALSEQKRRIAVEKELAELKGATPGLNGTGGGAGAPATEEEQTGLSGIFRRAASGTPFSS